MTLTPEFISPGHLRAIWTPAVDKDVQNYALQIINANGSRSGNRGILGAVFPPQAPVPQFSVSPVRGRTGTTFDFCTNNPITVNNLVVSMENGVKMIVPAQSGASCPGGQSGVTFTMSSTINAVPGFAEYNGNSSNYPQSFSIMPGFYQFTTAYDNSSAVHLSGKAGQTWAIEITP